jgi:hypothetical protein
MLKSSFSEPTPFAWCLSNQDRSMKVPAAVIFVLALSTGLPTMAHGQASVTTEGEIAPADRSFHLNQPVDDPESLSGVWQAPDGHGGAVGIQLSLGTMLSGDADPPRWTPQSWQYLEVGVFHRTGSQLEFEDQSNFSDSVRGGNVVLDHGHLLLHFIPSVWKDSAVDLDLVRQLDGCWAGRLHRGNFDSQVQLCRPTGGPGVDPSPLVGTWVQNEHTGDNCMHIAQTAPGAFIGWSDALQIPGSILFAPTIPTPHRLFQHFGELMKVDAAEHGRVELVFNPYNAMCCSRNYIVRLSADGSTLSLEAPSGAKGGPRSLPWKKMPGDSCVNPAELQNARIQPCPPGQRKRRN